MSTSFLVIRSQAFLMSNAIEMPGRLRPLRTSQRCLRLQSPRIARQSCVGRMAFFWRNDSSREDLPSILRISTFLLIQFAYFRADQ